MRFGKKGKLSSHFVGPFPIVKRAGNVAYSLWLPEEMSVIHNVFHASMLRKYIPDPNHVLKKHTILVQDEQSYEEKPMEMLDCTVKKLHSKEISMVKDLWPNHRVEEATWEIEKDIKERYPELFLGSRKKLL
ncbi:uncharacterized protein LOC133819959 [Humulus lupulus]|uniref:uncharacterized protein LOC133819959 n=1 Tax=Humulus lupulus TaxID=3486 RepID=UPI002B40D755|nr:uncharacterized protein LOC133819959 [Humulus lupulus]